MVDDDSLDNNSDEDNSNIEPESQCIKSGETFDSGVDLTQSVTSNCTGLNLKYLLTDRVIQHILFYLSQFCKAKNNYYYFIPIKGTQILIL